MVGIFCSYFVCMKTVKLQYSLMKFLDTVVKLQYTVMKLQYKAMWLQDEVMKL